MPIRRNKQPVFDPPSILETRDVFSSAVPIGRNRAVIVQRREHGGRKWVRLWTWNRHRKLDKWYPTRRIHLIPMDAAELLAGAVRNAAEQRDGYEPEWLVGWRREKPETASDALAQSPSNRVATTTRHDGPRPRR